ncbi:upstream activation factor subunit spp27 [Cladorrhinum sp. PSN259]|nr:upstream activation factor subunit spp27 [Cladorrhinum sp. PSN259]
MSAPLTDEETDSYSRIIDGILAAADLQTVTRKKIRQGLEAAIGKDLSDQKEAIKSLIEARFDAISSNAAAIPTPPSVSGQPSSDQEANGDYADEDDTPAHGEIEVATEPARKKVKRESSSEDADARLAAELQAQENRLSRGRVTRGAATSKPKAKAKAKAKTAKKKSSKRARSDDESDGEGGEDKPKRKAGGGFQKPFNLSPALSELCYETQLSRPQVVKKLWDYIKGNSLQDPNDKRQIICDEKLQAVFKSDKINMFSMNKALGSHLYPVEE